MTVVHSRALLAIAVSLVFATPSAATAQSRPFLYSVLPSRGAITARAVVYGDLGYGHNLFAAVGPERLEHRAGAQLSLSPRVTVLAQVGWALTDATVRSRASGGAEIVATLSPSGARTIFAVGLGGMRDYQRSVVVRGRIVAGYVSNRTRVVGNVNFERPVHVSAGDTRDAVDLITTVGLSHQVSGGLRLGVEAIAEDLEGFFEANEAEGGAKLMVGPSIGLGSRASRWNLAVVTGPVVRLTRSTASGTGSGAARDLNTGYVLRTSISYEW